MKGITRNYKFKCRPSGQENEKKNINWLTFWKIRQVILPRHI